MNHYIGVKRVQAEPFEKDGKPGYKVVYEDGYESWSQKDVFERAYLKLERPDKITETDIDAFMAAGDVITSTLGKKTAVVQFTAPTGFIEVDSSSCVDPKNYDHELGTKICMERITNKMWNLLGFVLQWANNGIKV